VAPGSGRSRANAIAAPDVELIETALAGGTVAREIFCAGTLRAPHEDEPHRPRIHEGMGLGCSRARESSCRVAGLAFRAKRTAASEPANNGPRFTPTPPDAQNHMTNAHHAIERRATGPGDSVPDLVRVGANPGVPNRNGTHPRAPSPVLAPGTALGSRLRVALSSGRATSQSTSLLTAESTRCARARPKTTSEIFRQRT
jgi:hypothetical protein